MLNAKTTNETKFECIDCNNEVTQNEPFCSTCVKRQEEAKTFNPQEEMKIKSAPVLTEEHDFNYHKYSLELFLHNLGIDYPSENITKENITPLGLYTLAIDKRAEEHKPEIFTFELISNLLAGIMPDEDTQKQISEYFEFVEQMEEADRQIGYGMY